MDFNIDELTVNDLVALDAYTNNMINSLQSMINYATKANNGSEQLLIEKQKYFKQKNLTIQKILMSVLDKFQSTKGSGSIIH
jgi:hypothetical protein